MIMWDRLKSNTVTVCPYIDIGCNQHARQNFKDLEDSFPKIIRPILNAYKRIFFNDDRTRSLSKSDRLAYHQEHSLPVFNAIVESCHHALDGKVVTDNSDLGQAFR